MIDAEGIYAAGGGNALRVAVRGTVLRLIREGRQDAILTEVAVPVVDLANALRKRGDEGQATKLLEHAVHDGVQAAVLAEAVEHSTTATVADRGAPPVVNVDHRGALYVGPPPAAVDLASTLDLTNYLRDRLLTF